MGEKESVGRLFPKNCAGISLFVKICAKLFAGSVAAGDYVQIVFAYIKTGCFSVCHNVLFGFVCSEICAELFK